MSRAILAYGLFFVGMAVTAFSGARLGHIVGVTWEFAVFAMGIWVSAVSVCGVGLLQTKKRIDDLEKKVSELDNARKV